jgi:hypothetical protein
LDIQFNPGITKFPKFTKAVLNHDYNAIRDEATRYVNGKPLGLRNDTFMKEYVYPVMAEDIVNERIKTGKFQPIKQKQKEESLFSKIFK